MCHCIFVVNNFINKHIIDIQHTPTLSISEGYEADNVTVNVEWTPVQQAFATYLPTISPSVPTMFIGSSHLRLTVIYNTEYNLSIVAVAPCRPNAIAFITLNYGEVYMYYIRKYFYNALHS